MKILVMGAGAVGAYFGARLQQAGETVIFCTRGANLQAMQTAGLRFASHSGDFALPVTATDAPRTAAPYDLILFSVKSYDTENAARSLDGCLAATGSILTLQNGVENEAILSRFFGPPAVMGGNARIGIEMVAPGALVHNTGGFIEFGPVVGGDPHRAARLAETFAHAGILGELTTNLSLIRWEKLLWNAAFNSVTALTHRKVGDVLDDPEGTALLRSLMREIVAVAQAEGVALDEAAIAAQFTRSENLLREVRTSTLQDYERGKPLEFEALSGAVVRTAQRHGLAIPHMAAVHALMKLLDGERTKPG